MLIITPHSKASFELDRQLKSQAAEGDALPQIVTVDAFLRWLWQQALINGNVLPANSIAMDFEEAALWEKVIREAVDENELKGVSELTQAARTVERACGWYAINIDKASQFHDGSLSQFARWLSSYQKACSKAQIVTLGQWTAWAADHVESLKVSGIDESMGYWGFSENGIPFNLQVILDGLGASAMQGPGNLESELVEMRYLPFDDERTELVAAFQWARELLISEPDKTVTIAVPGLSKRRWAVIDAAAGVLEPWYFLPRTDDSDRVYGLPFDFGATSPIKEAPIVRDVLALLSALLNGSVEDWATVAQSIYLWDCRFKKKHALVNRIKKYRKATLSVREFEKHRVDCGITGSPIAQDQFDPYASLTTAEWVSRIRGLLQAIGWPKKPVLGAGEFMALGRFNEALGQVAGCRIEHRSVGYARFLYLLRKACEQISFVPSPEKTRLEIIDWRNAQQIFSDAVWVVGANELTFPAQPKPLPFIPIQWQIEKGVENATAEWSLKHCVASINHVRKHCGLVWFSYSNVSEGLELKPAPLLAGFLTKPGGAVDTLPIVSQSLSSFSTRLNDEIGHLSPVTGEVRRGNEIIKNTAECPFKSIAVHRLRLDKFYEVELGLGVVERSKLIHAALEAFWRDHPDQAELTRWGMERLQLAVVTAVDEALEKSKVQAEWFEPGYFEKETAYVQERTLQTVLQDLNRKPFVVEGVEMEARVNVGGLSFLMRADRIDRIGDSLVLVDYKRSKKIVKEIARPRITEPQLPLLATAMDDVKGLFWIVTESEQKREGVCDENLDIYGLTTPMKLKTPDVCDDFDALKSTWRGWLETLAAQYESGDCRIDPVDGNQTCRNCHVKSVCRIAEVGGRGALEGEPLA
jgi:ATP-dependent helicase/nuclease subunit B